MLNARELRALALEAQKAKEEKEQQRRMEKEAQEFLEYENKAKEQFAIFFPQLVEKIKEIAGQGWSSCGVQIPRDDVAGSESKPDYMKLRGTGKLLYDAYKEKELELHIELELYDQGNYSDYVYYIEIIWDRPSEREKCKGNSLRGSIPLIRWCHLISEPKGGGSIETDYPK